MSILECRSVPTADSMPPNLILQGGILDLRLRILGACSLI